MPPKFRRLLLGLPVLGLVAACSPFTNFLALVQEFTPKTTTSQNSPVDRILMSGKYGGFLQDIDGELTTTIGKHYTNRTEAKPITVGHFLVLWPKIDYKNYNIVSTSGGTEHLGSFATVFTVVTLKPRNPGIPDCANSECEQEVAFRARFHADEHTFMLGNQTFARANGNLFIVRFDEHFNMQATQVPKVYEEIAKTRVILGAYKAALPKDKFIQSLKIKVRMVNGKLDEPGPD